MDVRSWTIKKAEQWRNDAFVLWCWRRLFISPWTARSSNQAILKEISLEYSLEGPMLKLKLQYFGHLMQSTHSMEKTLMLGKIEEGEGDNRGWDCWMVSPTWWTWVWANSWSGGGQGSLKCCSPWVTKNWTKLSDGTELKFSKIAGYTLNIQDPLYFYIQAAKIWKIKFLKGAIFKN